MHLMREAAIRSTRPNDASAAEAVHHCTITDSVLFFNKIAMCLAD